MIAMNALRVALFLGLAVSGSPRASGSLVVFPALGHPTLVTVPGPAEPPAPRGLRPFTTDGCSLFPDRDPVRNVSWRDCCVAHDMAYWRGGDEAERLHADEALRTCVAQRTGDARLAELMFQGVRAGGAAVFPTWYRWGYGWSYGRLYAPLTEAERALVDAELARWQQRRRSQEAR
jgi:hypothetical protein